SAHVAGEQDADGNYVGTVTVALHATDDSGVETVEYSLDGGAWTPYTDPVAITSPGAHTLRYRATDTAGNTSEAAEVTVTVAAEQPEPDTTAPEVTVSLGGDRDGDGSFVGAATLTLAATDDSGVASIEYALDRGGWTAYTEPIRITALGNHTVQYRATDTAGNTSAVASVTLTVVAPQPDDTTAPEVSATVKGQKDGEAYVGTATVVLDATDASGVASIEYDLDGAGWAAYTGPVAVTEPGAHTLRYRATDTAGNTSAPASIAFEVVDGEPGPGEPDACPDSDGLETVVIGGHDTTVANVDTGDGCTIGDLIAADGEYRNHGKFVSHVAKVTGDLLEREIISAVEKGRIQSAAARSDIGK
ncbi:OmpL47-type beta-barrel domain-containing protein, partial [Georgenia thermotolerans]